MPINGSYTGTLPPRGPCDQGPNHSRRKATQGSGRPQEVLLEKIGAVQLQYGGRRRYGLCAGYKVVSEVTDSKYTTWLEDSCE